MTTSLVGNDHQITQLRQIAPVDFATPEKFWDQGAEPLLQLAADHLSETPDLARFWRTRSQRLQSMRCYHAAA